MEIVAKRKIKYPIGLERAYAKEIVAHTKSLFTVVQSFVPKMVGMLSTSVIAFDDTEDELSRFPDAVHDDQVDAASDAFSAVAVMADWTGLMR